jgi:hypothetical protein
MDAADIDCSHSWKTCPLHNPDGGLPPFRTVMLCIYGGAETKDGGVVDEQVADDLAQRIADRLWKAN